MNTHYFSGSAWQCALAAMLGLASVDVNAGISHYTQPTQAKSEAALLWQKAAVWLENVAPLSKADTPDYHWIETNAVQNDRRHSVERMDAKYSLPVQKVFAPAGMFGRIESGAHTGGNSTLAHTPPPTPIPSEQSVQLTARLPSDLFVTDDDVQWLIRPQGQATMPERYLNGRSLTLALPSGAYDVSLRIGAYQVQQTVTVKQGQLAVPNFNVAVGRLRATSDNLTSWDVFLLQGNAGQKIMSQTRSYQLNTLVPAGEYEVVATIGDAHQRTRVRVESGGEVAATMEVPTGRINLMATLGDNPAMRPMAWKVFRLDGGRREVAAPMRHSASLTVPPGHYEAVATLDGKQRRREFTVMSGSDSSVVMAMD